MRYCRARIRCIARCRKRWPLRNASARGARSSRISAPKPRTPRSRRSCRRGLRPRTTDWLSKWTRHRFSRMLQQFDDPAARQSSKMDALVRDAVFGNEDAKVQARWMLWEIGQRAGVRPASIHELYLARGRGEVTPFTTPAINVRILSYDTGRAIFRAAKRLDVGAVICEIARSEIAYTDQRPAEYVAVMTAAALREGFTGPLFIQGDHVQVNAKKYGADAEGELKALRALIEEELHAGFYNIDIDTSTQERRRNRGRGGGGRGAGGAGPGGGAPASPAWEAVETPLATIFQPLVCDHRPPPADLRRDVNAWVKTEAKDEWKKGDTEEQFIYKSRKKAIGPFKRRFWDLPADVRAAIGADLEKTLAFLFEQLRVKGTRAATDRYVQPKLASHAAPRGALVAAPDDAEAGE